ncbi:ATP-binding cassette domain-containing protein [Paenibacillus macerans]|uniref:ABC transporter family protein n=2 Tax=Paenibacillus macerans TaxID=44252 RepID=A0A090YN19_PAEMA|nr:ABC transporter ATP-binding protein [Paenibacillus macerans]KFM93525.1 ABC transporter family protein [Paenibacillus macerans]MBS5911014.1 ABC transporter ATP-binding protein [Paenibacillus macerans]MCY7556982.1 ABC transporter ATP-binding protein/permease [Paenibacillus macerans]MEC0154327.1 ABC transporter ATP-binding protein [Paenibacillus macerans]MUG22268.1 ATP-binding cassette domain-containing protein [Paenibacillus macerans]
MKVRLILGRGGCLESLRIILQSHDYIKGYMKWILAILFIVMVNVVLNIVQPILWGSMLESVIKLEINQFVWLIFWLMALYIVEAIGLYIQSYLSTSVNENLTYAMKERFFLKIANYQMRRINKMGIGDVLSHLEGDVQAIIDVYTNQLLNVVIGVFKALIIGTIAFAISWPLAIVIVIMVPLNYIIMNKFGELLKGIQIKLRGNMDNYYSSTQEYLIGIKSVKSLGAKTFISEKFKELIRNNKFVGIRIGKLAAASTGLSGFVNFFTQLLVFSLGMYLLVNGRLTFPLFVAFSSYSVILSGALLEITQINPKLQQAVVSIQRINKVLHDMEEHQEHWGKRDVENIQGNVTIRDVSFGFEEELLHQIQMKFCANHKYAIVGSSGSGKSTLFNLLLKIYEVDSGHIYIDDININDIREDSFRNIISVVEQEPTMFHMSIRENIIMERKNTTFDEIRNAALKANIDEEILNMPEGYDTIINGRGDNLSVGQKQRIALARILLKNPRIILFDEVTSALDNISQELVNETINNLRKDHTIIVISHKISNIIDSDEIYVMNNGRIIGNGTHSQLLTRCEHYRDLFEKEMRVAMESYL